MSKLSDYLKKNKIDARRVVGASRGLERQTSEDRALVAKKAAIKAGKMEKDDAITKAKPRSGRRVTQPTMDRAVAGTAVSGPTKTRIVRAVNAILVARKKPEATFRDLF
jgi:hypothetical protein